MAIEVQCSACGKRLKAPDEQAGRRAKCPSCKAEITIPARAGTASADKTVPADKAAAGAGAAVGLSSSSSTNALVDAKNWFALSIGVRTIDVALIVECIACALISLGMIADRLKNAVALGDFLTQHTIELLYLWGQAAFVLGWAGLIAGWFACLGAWPGAERRWLRNTVWAASASVAAMLILVSLQIFGILNSAVPANDPTFVVSMPKPIILLGSIATAATLILFAFFLAGIQQRIGREKSGRLPIVYAAVIGTLTALCWIANLAIAPTTPLKGWLIVLSIVATFVAEFLWLWLINRSTSHELRVSQAWKRL